MANFQRIVLISAIIFFIIIVIFVGITMRYSKSKQQWPPIIGECPDYWIDLSGNGAKCVNQKNLGICKGNGLLSMDFTKAPYVGSNGMCAKYMWAKGCKLTWDGITSGVSNPCSKK